MLYQALAPKRVPLYPERYEINLGTETEGTMRVELTDRFIATIKANTITDFFDAKTKGLSLRVAPTGHEILGGDVHRSWL